MATTKKSTGKRTVSTSTKAGKKPAARKKVATSRTTASKRAAQASKSRSASTKSRSARTKNTPMKSFHIAKTNEPFVSLKVTVQTLYWLILSGAVLLLGLWVLNIHNKVQVIYDEIDQSTLLQQELDAKELQMLREKAAQKAID